MIEFEKIQQAVDFIKGKCNLNLETGLILGSGLGAFGDMVEDKTIIPYEEIPYFPVSSIPGHMGRLIIGKANGINIIVMQGRVHFYEGYTMQQVVFPVRVLCNLKIKRLILTNAAGGINKSFEPGDLMIIRDHINLMGGNNPLIGPNDERLGTRFPDMTDVYNKEISSHIKDYSSDLPIKVHEGVYLSLTGPTYETPAEVNMLKILGADAVGMSTVPEAIAARHCGVTVAGISCITNKAAGLTDQKLSHQEVADIGNKVAGELTKLLYMVVKG